MEPVPTIQPVSKQNNFLITLLSVLLLLSCIIAGFFAYQTQNLVKELTKLKNIPTPTSEIIPSAPPTIPSKFSQEYSNKEFTLNFPDECTQGKEYIECKQDKFSISVAPKLSGVGTSGHDDIKIIDLNGIKWRRLTITGIADDTFSAYDYNLSDIYIIGVYYNPFSQDAQNYFERILSTFKFTDLEPATSPQP